MLTLVKQPKPEFVEDIPDNAILESSALSNDQLATGGMTPVTSWMRTRSSQNALRVRKAKEKAATGEDGKAPRKQLNLVAPVGKDARDALKNVSEMMLSGEIVPADLDVIGRLDVMRYGVAVDRVYTAGGLRARLLRRLLK